MKKKEKLTREQKQELSKFLKAASNDAIEVRRAQAILMINDEVPHQMIKNFTGYSRRHAFQLRENYLQAGLSRIQTKKRDPKRLLTRGQREEVVKMLDKQTPQSFGYESKFWTTAILARIIKERYDVQYKSRTSLYVIFKEAKFSFHKPGSKYDRRDQGKIDNWKKEIRPLITEAKSDPNTVILVEDEMMLTTQTTFQKIWLPQGAYPKIEVSTKRNLRCVYGYLNIKNGVEHAFKARGANSQETIKTLEQIGKQYQGRKIILFWDNAIWHKSAEIKEYLEKTKYDFHLINFPPYAPDENPQEHVWKAGREQITHNKFIDDIDQATNELIGYFNETIFDYKFL